MSSNRKDVLAIARNEKSPSDAREIIKDPMILEFLELKKENSYYEKDLESAIIAHLQDFLLELGNGFAFLARQKRIHIDGDDFFMDLVFFNRLLRCFVIVEIKTEKLTHQDLGQLQMYVNYYDRVERSVTENSTIGILLCAQKNNSVVKFSLPESNMNIIASQYQLYLPTEKQLLEEVKKELRNFEEELSININSSNTIKLLHIFHLLQNSPRVPFLKAEYHLHCRSRQPIAHRRQNNP